MKRKRVYSARKLVARNRRFWISYSVLLLLIGFGFWQLVLYVDARLSDYEACQPKYAAAPFAALFTNRDFNTLYLYEDAAKVADITQEAYVSYAKGLTDEHEIEVKEAYSKDDGIRNYNVYASDTRFANFSIRKSGEKSKYGNDLWTFASLSMQLVNRREYKVQASENAIVFVNGQAVGSDLITNNRVETEYSAHVLEGVTPAYDRMYVVTAALADPEIVVTDTAGNRLDLTYKDGVYVADTIYFDDEMHDTYAARAEEVVTKIAKLSLHLATVYEVSNYALNNSEARTSIAAFNGKWAATAKKMRLENVVVEHFVKFDDTCFAVDVRCDCIATVQKADDYQSKLGYRLYFTLNKDQWLIYYFEMI